MVDIILLPSESFICIGLEKQSKGKPSACFLVLLVAFKQLPILRAVPRILRTNGSFPSFLRLSVTLNIYWVIVVNLYSNLCLKNHKFNLYSNFFFPLKVMKYCSVFSHLVCGFSDASLMRSSNSSAGHYLIRLERWS